MTRLSFFCSLRLHRTSNNKRKTTLQRLKEEQFNKGEAHREALVISSPCKVAFAISNTAHSTYGTAVQYIGGAESIQLLY